MLKMQETRHARDAEIYFERLAVTARAIAAAGAFKLLEDFEAGRPSMTDTQLVEYLKEKVTEGRPN